MSPNFHLETCNIWKWISYQWWILHVCMLENFNSANTRTYQR
uniref:Uncharacterized protein n=1 Tax=Lotus japonicus TaxID=34305 RepID=I3SEA5_LOTJA|nr:unknown [Lotus japonicus]